MRLAKYVRFCASGCAEWVGCRSTRGYGRVNHEGKVRQAHRVVYELFRGPIPEGLELDHVCRNRACVNPAHLEPVSHTENVRRGNGGVNNRVKTHCLRGHEFAGPNLRFSYGKRQCMTCRAERARRARTREVRS
jgi:hypothetical protein